MDKEGSVNTVKDICEQEEVDERIDQVIHEVERCGVVSAANQQTK